MNPLIFITNKINRLEKKKYKILTFPTHESYQTNLAETGHEFILLDRKQGNKSWNFNTKPLPKNTTIIESITDIDYDIDFILSQERFGQLQFAKNMSRTTRLPIVHLEHIEPLLFRWSPQDFESLKSIKADIHVFITDYNKNSWGNNTGTVVPHGIRTEDFVGWNGSASKRVLYIVNHLAGRDEFCGFKEWSTLKKLVNQLDPQIQFVLIGENDGMSGPISNEKDLVNAINDCSCYLNTSRLSPVPMSLMEAMSCGIPCVSTANQQVPVIMNGIETCSNNLDFLASQIVEICNNTEKAKNIGSACRTRIVDHYNIDNFVKNWNNVFDSAYNLCLENTI